MMCMQREIILSGENQVENCGLVSLLFYPNIFKPSYSTGPYKFCVYIKCVNAGNLTKVSKYELIPW